MSVLSPPPTSILRSSTSVLNPWSWQNMKSVNLSHCASSFSSHIQGNWRQIRPTGITKTPRALLRSKPWDVSLHVETPPFSTAECEGGFSRTNLICDELWSTITVQHLSTSMLLFQLLAHHCMSGILSHTMYGLGWLQGGVVRQQWTTQAAENRKLMQTRPYSLCGSCFDCFMFAELWTTY